MRELVKTERDALTAAMDALLEVVCAKDCVIRQLEEQLRNGRNRDHAERIQEMMKTRPGDGK